MLQDQFYLVPIRQIIPFHSLILLMLQLTLEHKNNSDGFASLQTTDV